MGRSRNRLGVQIGRLARSQRETKALSVSDVADRINRSEQEVRRFELGYHEPKLRTVMAVAKALGVQAREILPDGNG